MLVIAAKATSSWEKVTLAIKSLFWVIIEDLLISILITLSWRTSEPYTDWDLQNAQKWKFATEKSLLFILGALSTCYIFLRAHTDISHTPTPNARLGALEQGAAMDRTGEENDEFTDALSQQPVKPGEDENTKDTRDLIKALLKQLPGDTNEEDDEFTDTLSQQLVNPGEEEDTGDSKGSIKALPQQLSGDANEKKKSDGTNGASTQQLPGDANEDKKSDETNEASAQQLPAEQEEDNNDNDKLMEGLKPQLVGNEEVDGTDNSESSIPLPQRFAEDQEGNNDNNDKLIEELLQQLAETEAADNDHEDPTAVDPYGRPPSPRVFLRRSSTESHWRMETLRILAMSGDNQASDDVPGPDGGSVAEQTPGTPGSNSNDTTLASEKSSSILTEKRPQTPRLSPNQAVPAPEENPVGMLAQEGPHSLESDANQATPDPEGGSIDLLLHEPPQATGSDPQKAIPNDSSCVTNHEALISILDQAIPAPEGDCGSVLSPQRPVTPTQETPRTPQSNPVKALNTTPATPSETSSGEYQEAPTTPCPMPRRAVSPKTPTAPQSPRRSVLDTLTSPALSFEVPPWSQPASPAQSLAAALPEDDNMLPINPIPTRKGYKDLLYREAQGWPNALADKRLRTLIRYDQDDDSLPATGLGDTKKQQLVYETFARLQARMDNTKTFRVYGTPALFPLDRLRCWVLTNNHRDRTTPFPPNYLPIGSSADEVMSVSSIGMDSEA